jgi:hypothetical protein
VHTTRVLHGENLRRARKFTAMVMT